MKHSLLRPDPILSDDAEGVSQAMPSLEAAAKLRDGKMLMVTDSYSTGAEILGQLQSLMPKPPEDASYETREAHQRAHRQAALRLLAPIAKHQLALAGGRPIGFLKELYPELSHFVLPFLVVQELHGAWGRFQEGSHLAVLGHRVHPFFGTYVPTRTVHLELFGTWLSQYPGARTRAVDVGTGCGVLALMLAKAGFGRVLATDKNPNAIESVKRQLERMPSAPAIDLRHCDLLGEDTTPADLIVFNPPWVKGKAEDLLDQALVFEDNLLERFFDQAIPRLTPDGRIVIIFSNLIQLIQPDVPHPILTELDRGRLQLIQKIHRKVKPARSKSGQRRKTREKVEVWELARA